MCQWLKVLKKMSVHVFIRLSILEESLAASKYLRPDDVEKEGAAILRITSVIGTHNMSSLDGHVNEAAGQDGCIKVINTSW